MSNFRSDVGESTSLNVGVDAQKFPEGNPRGSNEIKEDETKRLVICNFCHRWLCHKKPPRSHKKSSDI